MSKYDGLISPVASGGRGETFEKRKENMRGAWPNISEEEKKQLIGLLMVEACVSNRTCQYSFEKTY